MKSPDKNMSKEDKIHWYAFMLNPCVFCEENIFRCEMIDECEKCIFWKEFMKEINELIKENKDLKEQLRQV